jgi:CDP-diacylglycerol--glycerol-3-phosphate 3-phosphatidyltransferase
MRSDSHAGVIPKELIRSWVTWAIAGSFFPGILLLLLRGTWEQSSSILYLFISYLAFAYQLIFIRRNLYMNQREDDPTILPKFGPGNTLSLARGLILVLLAGFLFSPRPTGWQAWLPVLLYTTGDIADYFDGYLARRSNHVTRLGERMDMEWDAFGLLVATTLAVCYGILPWMFLPIGLARYAYSIELWFRDKRGKPTFALPSSKSRRPIAGLTMGYMSAMLWPIIPYPASAIAGSIFLLPFALSFGRDWLVVSGTLDPSAPAYLHWRSRFRTLLLDYSPLLLRIGLVITLWNRIWYKLTDFNQAVHQFVTFGFPSPHIIVPLFTLIELIGLVSISLGFAGRFASFLLIFPIGFTIIGTGQDAEGTILLITTLLIMILGTGRFSLWRPADTLFGRRAGED